MDEHFGDVYGIISDREIEISHELAQFVLQYEELLTRCSDICGELDRCENKGPFVTAFSLHASMLALAQGAKVYNLVRPCMTPDNVIDITGGRFVNDEGCKQIVANIAQPHATRAHSVLICSE